MFLSRSSTSFCLIRLTKSTSEASGTYRRFDGELVTLLCPGVVGRAGLVDGGVPGGVEDSTLILQLEEMLHRSQICNTPIDGTMLS